MNLRPPLILSSDRARRGRVSKDDWIIDLGSESGDKPVLSEAEGGGEIVADAEHDGRCGGSFIARKNQQVAKVDVFIWDYILSRCYTGSVWLPGRGKIYEAASQFR